MSFSSIVFHRDASEDIVDIIAKDTKGDTASS